jgi:high affinity Mn2+ porin
LNYRPESIVETYYSYGLSESVSLSLDYQFIANPGFNYMRGPVSIGSVRLHVAL